MADIMTDTPTQHIPNTPTNSSNTAASSITASLLFTQDAMQPEIKTEPPLEINDYDGGYDDSSNSNEIQTNSHVDTTPKIRLTPASKLLASPTPKDPKRKFICPYENCTKSYGKSSHLRSHLTWHTGVKPFVCKELSCGKGFTRSDELNRHMRTHTGEKPFECVQCSKKFSRSDHLTKHLGTHAKQTNKKTEKIGNGRGKSVRTDEETEGKDDVGVHFMVANNIASSKQLANGNFQPQSENFSNGLEENTVHVQVKVERTDDNDSSYNSYNDSMQTVVPEQTHAEEPSPSAQNTLPEVDVKSEIVNTNNRPHQCSECLRSFKRHDDLNRHMRTHTGQKPYPCTECEKRFLRSDHLKKHLKTHLKGKLKKA